MKSHKHLPVYLGLILLLWNPAGSLAITVNEILPSGLHVTADYRKGSAEKPAILILHGFLTVHSFSLIQKLAEELNFNDYPVLAPTLSLGISKRRSTLACDALHLHSMKNDIDEVNWWVQWLIDRGHDEIILIGHSTGAMQVIQYVHEYPDAPVSKVISISLVPLGRNDQPRLNQSIKTARGMVDNNDSSIHKFSIAYCIDNYSSPPQNFLSYANWNSKKLLSAIKSSPETIQVIMGGADDSVYPKWIEHMKQGGADVSVIDGANHFFNSGHEFELYDSLMKKLDH